ncbi:MAG: ankyrin repeat domain-containing protein [Flavobacteriaceae bacterium]
MQKTIAVTVLVFALSVGSLKALTLETFPQTFGETTLLIEKGFNNNPLHLSVVKGDLETVQKLIELGADVNQKWNGMTPAMYAARHNRVEILKVLIAQGANLKMRCDKGRKASYYAKHSGAKDAASLIEQTLAK